MENENFVLVENKKALCAVVFGEKATPAEVHASEELAKYIGLLGNTSVCVLSENDVKCKDYSHLLAVGSAETSKLVADGNFGFFADGIPEKDAFYIKTSGSNIFFCGCRNRATVYSVYHFLEKYLNAGFFWDGDAIYPEDTLSVPAVDLYEESAFLYRFSRSGADCNAGYTFTSWWNFDQWKNEIDFLMKNKVNIARIGLGFDLVVTRAYKKMGIAVGEESQTVLDRIAFAKKVYEYCNMLGLQHVNYLPGFTVSDSFYNANPGDDYYSSIWVTGDEYANNSEVVMPKPRNLFPDSETYARLIKAFLESWRETYGYDDKMFIIQTPCESKTSVDLSSIILKSLSGPAKATRAVIPDAKIMIDGWNFRFMYDEIWKNGFFKKFICSADENEVVVMDIWPSWRGSSPLYQMETFKDINCRPFFIAFLNEFGGDNNLQGDFDAMITEGKRLLTDASASNACGLGNTAEMMYFNVNYYDLMYRMAWNPMQIKKDDYVNNLVLRRYGKKLYKNAVCPFRQLIDAAYSGRKTSWGSAFQANLHLPKLHESNPEKKPVIVSELEAYIDKALPFAEEEKNNKFVLADVYEGLRQYLTEKFNNQNVFLENSCYAKDKAMFHHYAGNLLIMANQFLKLTASNKRWYIESEVRKLEGHLCNIGMDSSAEAIRAYIRDVGTTFGKSEPRLLDYSRKDYHELDKYYYYPRTEAYIDFLSEHFNSYVPEEGLDQTELDAKYKSIVDNWINTGYPPEEVDKETMPLWKAIEEVFSVVKYL